MAEEPSVAAVTSAGRGADLAVRGSAKLTAAAVRKIRAQGAAGRDYGQLAREFGVTRATVGCIVRGITWKHLG